MFRPARAVVFATVCTGLATAGHTMASHAPVPPLALVAGLLVLIVVGLALSSVERSLLTILSSLLGGQFLLHVLFAAAQRGGTGAHAVGGGEPGPYAGHGLGDLHVGHGGPVHGVPSGFAMTLAHVVAAVVSAWWLRRGERAVWGLARKVATALARPGFAVLAEPVPLPRRARLAPRAARTARPRVTALRHVLVRRGPPSPSLI